MSAYVYDTRNRQTSETKSASDSSTTYVTEMEYDGVGNLISITEPGTGTIEYEYDGLNRKIYEFYPDGGKPLF